MLDFVKPIRAGGDFGPARRDARLVVYRNPKQRIHARPLYYGDNDDARSRPGSDIFRKRATWTWSMFV